MTGELLYDLRSWTANQLAYGGSADAWARTDALIEAARDGYVRHSPGLPLMIDGVDCSPENVRSLERQVKRLKGIETDR